MKKNLLLLLKRFSLSGIFFLFTVNTFAYTPPTALRVLWTGADQSATCHQYGDCITNVTFAGINNTTTVGTYGWHFDYGRTTPQVTPGEVIVGQSYPISVTVTGQDLSYQYIAVYVDWNQNNVSGTAAFPYILDANENPVVWSGNTGTGSKTLTGTINVPAGISPGQIYMRVMLDADTGGANGGDYTCAIGFGEFEDYVLNVKAASLPPTATTGAASSISTTGATLNGTINANNASSTVTFEYGTTTSYGTSVTADQSPVTGSTATSVSKAIAGLTPNTTYHFRVNGVNTAGTTNGTDQTFTTSAAVPTATTSAASSVTTTGATLNGSVNANNASTAVSFDYGTTTSYGTNVIATQSPVTGTTSTAVSYVLSGLVPNTTYHFRVNGVNTAGTTNGLDLAFTTTAAVPTATTSAATVITTTGATLNGSINANNASTTVSFDYGTTTSYGTNVTATQSPVTGTTATAVSYVLSGLVPNTTYHFRVNGVNTAGTTNAMDLTFTTTASLPIATTSAATVITTTGAILNGSVNANNASTVVSFDYGLTTSYGTNVAATPSPVTGTSSTAVSKAITGLIPNTTYHFRVNGVNTAGTTNAMDLTFTTTADESDVTTLAATTITTTGATLNGSVNANNASTVVTFEYGLTTSYGTSVTATQSPVTGTTATAVSYVLAGLVPNTSYHFRVNGVNTAGTSNGTDLTFTTTAAVPTATTLAATTITTTGTTLNGSVNANNASTVVTFEYGLTTSYGTSVTATQSPVTGTSATAVSYVLTGLVPNTTYHFRVNGVNTAGMTNGTDLTFTTTAAVSTATTSAATVITTTGATLNGTINANNASTVVTFEYGLTTSYGTSVTATQSPVTGTSATAVSYVLTGLVPNTTYHFRVNGVNTAGMTNGTDLTFTTTAAVSTATTSAATSITTTGATLNGTINANNASTVVTFEYGLTTSYGTSVTATQSPVTGTTSTAVSYVLTGLVPNTTYHFRVNGVNTAGTSNGTDLTFTTTAAVSTATTSAATVITTTGATLNGTINANNASTVVTFEYGLTTSYGTSVTATQSPVTGTSATAVSSVLSGLVPNTTYHFRVNGVNTAGTTNGTDLTFTTTAAVSTATTSAATSITTTGATLNGTINANNASTVVTFEYGLTTSYGTRVSAVESPVTGITDISVSITLTGLSSFTTYHYRIESINAGGTTYSTDKTFITDFATGLNGTGVNTLSVYPNPAVDFITFNASESKCMVYVYNTNGILILNREVKGNCLINISSLQKGVYTIKVNGLVGKLIKK